MKRELLETISEARKSLLRWFRVHGRDFPWRRTKDPYRILVAEMMLHRTRVEQVVPVYCRFVDKYPDAESFSRADDDELVEILSPLGLRWRINSFLTLKRVLSERFDGRIPHSRDELRSLPGVSDYICVMIRCLAFECPDPPPDTNTIRLCGRFFSLPVTDSSRRSRIFRQALHLLMDPEKPSESALALVDAGALVCRKKNPSCSECPLSSWCEYAKFTAKNEDESNEPGTSQNTF